MGVEMPKEYDMPDGTTKKFGNICWYTTLHTPDKKKLVLTKRYHHELYPHYDNYNAIEVGRVKDIPYDYDCVMGVPITIFQYDLDNVEVLKCLNDNTPDTRTATVEGKEKYCRVLIKKKIEVRQLCASHGKTPRGIENENCYVDGKWKYPRILIRLTRRK